MRDDLYIGLMSGTSMDGIDAVLVRFTNDSCVIESAVSPKYPQNLRSRLEALIANADACGLAEFASLHTAVARAFGAAVIELLKKAGASADTISAIGSHGQTVFHNPDGPEASSIQIGDPGTLSVLTGIPVVADFRNTDIALGGQGAPLVPAFHRWLFNADQANRAIVNIGGIANITLLYANGVTTGFDTGPGNGLMDAWSMECRSLPFDEAGAWGATGSVDSHLLQQMRSDPYFSRKAPKSTGREYFNAQWLREQLARQARPPAPQDVQATLCELTATEIAAALPTEPTFNDLVACGGGAHNHSLMERLRNALPNCGVRTSGDSGVDADWVEAAAFAWLARQRLQEQPTNIPAVTGASAAASLGGVYLPPQTR